MSEAGRLCNESGLLDGPAGVDPLACIPGVRDASQVRLAAVLLARCTCWNDTCSLLVL